MELISKELYHAGFGTLAVGESTEGRDIPEEIKEQMLKDHPEWFEVAGASVQAELVIETPEDSLTITNGEAKLAKLTRKK